MKSSFVFVEKEPSLDSIVVGVNVAILLLVLVSIWVCCLRMRTHANPQEAASLEPAVAQPIAAGPVAVPRLDQHAIDMFLLLSFQRNRTVGFGKSDCVIRFEEFMEGGNVRALLQKRIYHPNCISTWLTSVAQKMPCLSP